MNDNSAAKKLIIIGAGDFGREVLAIVERINCQGNKWMLMGFVDDDPDLVGKTVGGYPVLGDLNWLLDNDDELFVVCSLGNSETRKTIIERIDGYDHIQYATLIDPSVIIMNDSEVGEGSIIAAGTVVTVNVVIGRHSIINLNCTIGHDTITGDFFTAHPGTNISGKVTMEDASYFGTGCKVIQGLHIAGGCIFGAGSVVINNINEAGTYVGNPVRRIK